MEFIRSCTYDDRGDILNIISALQLHGITWQTVHTDFPNFNLLGWWFLFGQIGPFYFVLTLLILRLFAGIAFLADFARSAAISVNPLHPDKVGGLKPVATIGLQNQIIVAIVGINIGTMFFTLQTIGEGSPLWMEALAVTTYLVLAPIVFVGPLIPFRRHLIAGKSAYLSRIGHQFKRDLDDLVDSMENDPDSYARLQKLDRLTALNDRIARLPEWPLDTTTVRRFAAIFLTPALSVIIPWIVGMIVEAE